MLEPLEPVDPALPLLPGGVVLLPVPPAELPGGVPGEPGLEGEVADRLLEGLPGAPPLVLGLLP